jgi:hypothetical protein
MKFTIIQKFRIIFYINIKLLSLMAEITTLCMLRKKKIQCVCPSTINSLFIYLFVTQLCCKCWEYIASNCRIITDYWVGQDVEAVSHKLNCVHRYRPHNISNIVNDPVEFETRNLHTTSHRHKNWNQLVQYTYLLTYLLHGAESFLRSWAVFAANQEIPHSL